MKIKITYNTTLPAEGFNPKVTISDDEFNTTYFVIFIDKDAKQIVAYGQIPSNGIICANRQWFTNWRINIYKGKEKIYTEDFNPTGKRIFIKSDATALGDNLAWVPYFEEFRIKHNCIVICSTFFNEIFQDEYPELIFVPPKIHISNVYARYYIGSRKPDNIIYSPRPYGKIKLQQAASDILGLEYKEICAKITKPKVVKTKSVCISERASAAIKEWPGGWQQVVDYLVYQGYEVKVISKEATKLKGVTDKTGDFLLQYRIKDLCEAQFFIGVSSGLAWLAHSCDTHVFIISDHTPKDHEFSENCTRIYSDKCREEVTLEPLKNNNITAFQVISAIRKFEGK